MNRSKVMPMTWAEKAKEHWLILLLASWVAVGGIAWKTLDQFLVRPRDFEIERLRNQVGEVPTAEIVVGVGTNFSAIDEEFSLVVLEARLREGETVMAGDGSLVIKAEGIRETEAIISGALLLTDTPILPGPLKVGHALKVTRPTQFEAGFDFEIRLIEIRDGKAHFVVRRWIGDSPERPRISSESEPEDETDSAR